MQWNRCPTITAEITFLRKDEGGRSTAPIIGLPGGYYMPHIVIQSRDVRKAIVDAGRGVSEPYQGIAFLEGPADFLLGDSNMFKLSLMYYPDHPYADVQPGATFTIREGGKIVAHGKVLDRIEPLMPE